MTRARRESLKAAIDAEVRKRTDGDKIDTGDVLIFETEVDEAIAESEEYRRAALVWKDQPWRLFTKCGQCGEMRYCCGPTRDSVVCLRDYIAGPPKRRKSMSGTTTSAVSLREPLIEKLSEALDGKPVVLVKASYSRVTLDGKTIAYVNGDRKLKIDGAGLAPISVTEKSEIAAAVKTIAANAKKVVPAEPTVADATQAAVTEAAAAASDEVEPDPKPEPAKKSRSRSRSTAKA